MSVRTVTLGDVCAVACAEMFRGDGEIVANPIGNVPTIGARLARATFEPDLVLTDGEAMFVAGVLPLGGTDRTIESWNPYSSMFAIAATGRRHVVMGASQIDRYGNQNIACIGPWTQPKVQLIGVRGAPANTINHPTSYWIGNHSPRVFVEQVDVVCGIGYDRAATLGSAARFHEIRRVVTDLAVLDFATSDHRMRLVSAHPGIPVADVVAATGFELEGVADARETRLPTDEELALLDVIDPAGIRNTEVKNR